MKKKFIIFIMTIFGLMAEIHPTLSLKGTGIGESSLYEWNITKLSFDQGKYFININLENDKGDKYVIGNLDKGTEVLSVFYDDISGDSLKEVFLITRFEGKYGVEVYQETYRMGYDEYEFNKVYSLSDYLSGLFADEKNLNANKVRKITKNLLPADYGTVGYWNHDQEGKFYKGIDFFNGTLVGYYTYEGEKLDNIENANNYVVHFRDNIYGRFIALEGYGLYEIFEGKIVEDKVIEHGKYAFSIEGAHRHGEYVNGVKEGKWYDYLRGGEMYYYYENGVEVGSEVVEDE